MSLGRRLTLQLLLFGACVALLAAVGLWGVATLRQDFSVALNNYERLRQLYLIGFHLRSAATQLQGEFPNPALARREAVRAEQVGLRLAGELPVAENELLACGNCRGQVDVQSK
jgi:hypothetical protein